MNKNVVKRNLVNWTADKFILNVFFKIVVFIMWIKIIEKHKIKLKMKFVEIGKIITL